MDESFALFVDEFGEPTSSQSVPERTLAKYVGVLPDCLLSFWKSHGFASFANGLFWFVDPDGPAGRAGEWARGIPELDGGEFIVFARTAFGDLYAFQPETGRVLSVFCTSGLLMTSRRSSGAPVGSGTSIQSFLAVSSPEDFDFTDENDLPLFARAVETLGVLNPDEVYGFEPLLALGGRASLENLRKLRMDVHLDILRQFSSPELRTV